MNERIDQLLVKAGAYFGGDGVVYDRFDPKKFAELIVRECIEQVITGPNGPAHYAVEAAIRLKKYFGVKE